MPIDEKYLASKLRSNEQKMQARWSKRIYTIRTVKSANSDTGFMPEYILTISGDDDEDRSVSQTSIRWRTVCGMKALLIP